LSQDPRAYSFNTMIQEQFPELLSQTDPELILVAGGDGAMLHAVQAMKHYNVPFLGKALGTLNFLMNTIEDDRSYIENLLLDKQSLELQVTNTITISCQKENSTIFLGESINDIVLGDSIMDYHHFRFNTEDGSFKDFEVKGTGICISTPLGSTAFNFNNNGKILPLNSNLWSITGIVCNRYVDDIITAQDFTIELLSERILSKLFIDGIQINQILEKDSRIILSPGNQLTLAFSSNQQFLQKRIDLSNRFRK